MIRDVLSKRVGAVKVF